jgi:integrase
MREKTLSDGRVSLYLDIYQNGKRSYEFLKVYYNPKNKNDKKHKKELAENIRAKRELEISCSEHGFVPSFKRRSNFVEYFRAMVSKKKNRSWRACLYLLEEFTEDSKGRIPFNALTVEWLEEFKRFLLSKVNGNTPYIYFATIKAALNQALREGILTVNPAANVKQFEKKGGKRVYLTEEEQAAMAGAPCEYPEVKYAFLFACQTGLRISDVQALTWGDVQGTRIEITQEKTDEPVYLDLSPMAIEIIRLKRKGNVAHFPTSKLFKLPPYTTMRRALEKMAKAAGITKHVTFHVSRHTFATTALTEGTDLYTVSKLLGHTDISTTQIYAKIVDRKKKEAMERMPKFQIVN